MSMPPDEVKTQLDSHQLKRKGTATRMRQRLLMYLRKAIVLDDNGESEANDETPDEKAEKNKAKSELVQLQAKMGADGKSSKVKKGKPSDRERDEPLLIKRIPPSDLARQQEKYIEKGTPTTVTSLFPESCVFFAYGDPYGNPYAPGQGATPGEMRLSRFMSLDDQHCTMQRLEIGGAAVKW